MKTLTLLFLLALPLFAAPQVLEKPGDSVSGNITGIGNTALAGTIAGLAISTNHMTITRDKPTENGYPSPDSKFTASLSKPDILSVYGHIIITKQEAADVVKALEILDKYSDGGTVTFPESTQAIFRSEAEWLRIKADALDQRAKDLAWARAVLEVWRGKVKEAGK